MRFFTGLYLLIFGFVRVWQLSPNSIGTKVFLSHDLAMAFGMLSFAFGLFSVSPKLWAWRDAEEGTTMANINQLLRGSWYGIGGLMTDGTPTFANARYVTGQVEFDAWSGMDNDGFKANVLPLADRMSFLGDGGDVASGITGMAAFGHSLGHMVYRLESEGEALTIIGDTANHPIWSLERPDWEVRFDMDKAAAAASRRKVFGMLADEKSPFIGYHMPFPAMGYVETRGDGFRWVPAGYQMML